MLGLFFFGSSVRVLGVYSGFGFGCFWGLLMYLGFGFLLWVLEGLFGLVCGQVWVLLGGLDPYGPFGFCFVGWLGCSFVYSLCTSERLTLFNKNSLIKKKGGMGNLIPFISTSSVNLEISEWQWRQ
jgi:hypothetical protein